jgi:hypothetical protein
VGAVSAFNVINPIFINESVVMQMTIEPVSDRLYDIESFQPSSGRLIGEDGKAYNLVDILRVMHLNGNDDNGDTKGNDKGFFKSVATYADLPQPAGEYRDLLYFVQASTGGLLSGLGVYKHPRGFYMVGTSDEWEQAPISVSVSDNAFTMVNITDWLAFMSFTKEIHPLDVVLYDGVIYQSLTGVITTAPPPEDMDNWVLPKGLLGDEAEPPSIPEESMKKGVPGIYRQGVNFPAGLTELGQFLNETISNRFFEGDVTVILNTPMASPYDAITHISNVTIKGLYSLTVQCETPYPFSTFRADNVQGALVFTGSGQIAYGGVAFYNCSDIRFEGNYTFISSPNSLSFGGITNVTVGAKTGTSFKIQNNTVLIQNQVTIKIGDDTPSNMQGRIEINAIFGTGRVVIAANADAVISYLSLGPMTWQGQIIDNRAGHPMDTFARK